MLGTAPAVSGQGTGAGSAIELSTEHCIAAVAKHANFFNCSISESLNDRGEFENTSRMPLTPFWTHNGTATIDRTRKARHAWKSTRGSNSVSSQNSNFPVRMHSPDIPDSVLKQEPRVGAVSPIRARQITAPSLSLRSATAAPVAPVDLHASSVNRTMKSFTPNSFDQTLSSNASNDGDAAAFRGSLGTQTGSLAMSGPTLLLCRGNGDIGQGWCDIGYPWEKTTGLDPMATVPELMR